MIPALTGVRGIAAIWVVLYHFRLLIDAALPNWSLFRDFISVGYLGVDLFAVLSGFVISLSYSDALSRFDRASTLRFLWFRLARIYPMIVMGLLLLTLIHFWEGGVGAWREMSTDMSFWRQLLLVNGWGLESEWAWNIPSWTVSSEWLCYLLFPLAAPHLSRIQNGRAAGVFASVAIAGTILVMRAIGHPDFDAFLDWGLLRIGGEFLTGCCLYQAFRLGLANGLPWSTIGAVATLLAFACAKIEPMLTIIAFVVVVYALAHDVAFLNRIFANRVAVYFGEISYSVYMMHWIVVWDVNRVLHSQLIQLSIGFRTLCLLGIVFTLSSVTYYTVERPARARMRRLFEDTT